MAATRTYKTADRQARLEFALIESAVASTSALVSFVATLYRYAPDTLAHVQRVAATSLSIGGGLELSTEQLRHIERAALVHDLGKLILPDDGADEDKDDREMRGERPLRARQVIAAADLLRASPVLAPTAQIVGALCEQVDGTGWPHGLQGTDIPVGARVVGVADAYDALTSLCVELVLSPEVIAEELVRHAGTRFDANVVAACLRWMDSRSQGPRGAVAPDRPLAGMI